MDYKFLDKVLGQIVYETDVWEEYKRIIKDKIENNG